MQFPNILFKFWSAVLIDKVIWTSIRAQHCLLTADYFIYMEPNCWSVFLAQRNQIPYSISWVVSRNFHSVLFNSFVYKYTSQPRHVAVFIPAASLTRAQRAIVPGPSWARMEEMDHDLSLDVDVEETEIIRLLTAVNTYPGERGIDRNSMSRCPFGKRVSNPIESSGKSSSHLLCERLEQKSSSKSKFSIQNDLVPS